MKMIRGRVALVTGAGRGIGAACAELLAEAGAAVVLCSRTQSELDSVAASIRARDSGSRVLALSADLAKESEILRVFAQAKKDLGLVSILVNNAAIFRSETFPDVTAACFEETMRVNVQGPYLCSRELFRHVKEIGTGGGAIVNISSLGGIRSTQKFPGFSAYVTSKHALVGMTESLAVEGKGLGIRVNCVAPGAVDTEMLRKAAPFLKTRTRPEDVAKSVLFFCDEARSAQVSGSVLEIHSNE